MTSKQPIDYAVPLPRGRALAASVSRRLRRAVPYLIAAMVCYTGSYACLSAFGRFVPAAIGSAGVKGYHWAPAGFQSGFRARRGLYYVYLPLYVADRTFWHRPDDAYGGKYPTTTPATAAEWAEWRR